VRKQVGAELDETLMDIIDLSLSGWSSTGRSSGRSSARWASASTCLTRRNLADTLASA
jgi:hypothetical protein